MQPSEFDAYTYVAPELVRLGPIVGLTLATAVGSRRDANGAGAPNQCLPYSNPATNRNRQSGPGPFSAGGGPC